MLVALLEGRIVDAFLLNPLCAMLVPVSLIAVTIVAILGPGKFGDKLARLSADAWVRFGYVTFAAMLFNWIYLLKFGSW